MQHTFGFRYPDGQGHKLYRIVSIGHGTAERPEYRWQGLSRKHGGLIFQYTLSGEGRLRLGEDVHRLVRGQAFLVTVPSDHEYYYEQQPGNVPWEFVWLRVEGMLAEEIGAECIRSMGPIVQLEPGAPVLEGLWRLYGDVSAKRIGDKFDMSLRLYEWLLLLQKACSGGSLPLKEAGVPDAYERAAAYIRDHLHEDISLEDVALIVGITKHHLCKTFPRYFGCTPMDYVRNRRIEQAARLLRQSGLSVTEIARSCGFSSTSYFGKVFVRLVGLTPSQYREASADRIQDMLHVMD
ncbi:AraC-type DNA-binding protein [Paenibacillus sp. UNCCL117]|uniref:AraC family transcriptional regulator n=1 Tax=unclassified Paenibacillus TaxID=185978 RepID=UPI00087FBAF9|nr:MULTISPECIES: AraC family transcriptional regulator [unclassified Paenibacillus]SDE37117.1 AraC-type DNA-binding protein [Paenibacillus sp. cl123]SFW64889.1 AraC-type DNA-binding protein [Paenibacillus sp. UNCCL117]